MPRKILSFILQSRLENIAAVGVSVSLFALFLTTRLFHAFSLGMHDVAFLLLPVGVLAVKMLLNLLSATHEEAGAEVRPMQYLLMTLQPFVRLFRDWFPFVLLSACYFSLYSNLILRVNPHTADAALSSIDAFLTGNQPSLMLEPLIRPWMTDLLNGIYFSFVLYLPGIAVLFYVKRERPVFRRLMMGYLTLILMGVTSYVVVPAVGPEIFLASRFHSNLQGQALSHGIDFIMQNARVSHDCFPSLHVGIPLLLAFYLRDHWKRAIVPAMIYVGLMCLATIYLRYHYLIDVLAAFVYAPMAYYLNDFLLARWPGEKIVVASLTRSPEFAAPAGTEPFSL